MDAHTFRTKYGPRALVIGGSEGLGGEFARQLAARGLDLTLVARREGPLQQLARELEAAHGIKVHGVVLDASEPASHDALLEQLEGEDIGLCVCSAAVMLVGDFLEQPLERHLDLINLNCRLAAVLSHTLGRRMAARRRGGIVLVSSMAGLQGIARVAHYAASKAYLRVLAEGLWEELRGEGVSVIGAVCGFVSTPTFAASSPQHPAWLLVPVMEPAPVVARTLEALGKQATITPGLANKLASFLNQRLLPRRLALALNSATTRAMYPARRG